MNLKLLLVSIRNLHEIKHRISKINTLIPASPTTLGRGGIAPPPQLRWGGGALLRAPSLREGARMAPPPAKLGEGPLQCAEVLMSRPTHRNVGMSPQGPVSQRNVRISLAETRLQGLKHGSPSEDFSLETLNFAGNGRSNCLRKNLISRRLSQGVDPAGRFTEQRGGIWQEVAFGQMKHVSRSAYVHRGGVSSRGDLHSIFVQILGLINRIH